MYKFLKIIIGTLLKQFFSEVKIRGAAQQESGAVLIVVNHPNMALDSLLIADSFKRELWFIAKATLFSNQFLKWFFNSCHMLPVQRRQDSIDASVATTIDNRDTFAKVVDKLCSSQAVAIFPEGVSLGERKILPLKTGAARMAFEAEESSGFKLGLKIQAAGITYSKLESFKSSVTITFAEPVSVSEYKSQYEADAQNAVRLLTDRIENELKKVTVTIENENHIELVEKISNIYRSKERGLDDKNLMQVIAANVSKYDAGGMKDKKGLLEKIDIYSELAALFAVDGSFALENKLNKFLMFLSLPFFFLSYAINIIPYRLVGIKAGKDSIDPVYRASTKFGYGILIFTSWYLLLSLILSLLIGGFLWFLLAFIFCIATGYFLNKYLNCINLFIISNFWPVNKKPVDLLLMIRDDLISELNSIRLE